MSEKEAFPCDNFTLDMHGTSFGVCTWRIFVFFIFYFFFFRVQFVFEHIMYSLCRSVSEYGEWGVLLWLVERFRRLCVSS
jgi:hypothetical protein